MTLAIKTAVFPVAGLGTRSLPATKAIPKEMLCVVDKPVLQYAVEEAAAAGVETFIFVISRGKAALEDHFDYHPELYGLLEARNKIQELARARSAELPEGNLIFVRQAQPLGLGHAIWCARRVVGRVPFAVLLPDEIFLCKRPLLAQMVDVYEQVGGNLLAVREVERELTDRYGILDVARDDGRVAVVRGLREKPKPADAPSTLSIVGRYILQPEVFDMLDDREEGAGGEIQLTDGLARLIGRQPVHGLRFDGERYDCGSRLGFIAANIAFGLANEELSGRLLQQIDEILGRSMPEPVSVKM